MSNTRRWLSFDDLVERGYPDNRTTIYRWIGQKRFPPGKLLGPNMRRWTIEEIEAHEANLAAA